MVNPRIKQIADSLTKAQVEAMLHKNAGGTSYSWARMQTLDALRKRGLLYRKTGPGAMYCPQTAIEWPLTPDGLAVRQLLQERTE